MRTPAVLLLVLAVAAAELGWKPNNEYRYQVTSKTLTSLRQVGNQYSGDFIKALLTINAITESHLIARISEAQMSSWQAELPEGPEGRIPEQGLTWEKMPITSEPFEIKLKNAIVSELVISRQVPIWEVNIIRAIVSQFQVDTQGEHLIPSKLNSLPTEQQNFGVYKTMEDTVDGECEVVYDVSPLPQYMWQSMPALVPQPQLAEDNEMTEIIKTKNFTHCDLRPVYHFGLSGSTKWEPASGHMGEFLARSSVSRVVVSGTKKSYTIQSSSTISKVVLSPEIYNQQKGEVFSQLNVTLSQVKPVTETVKGPSKPQTIRSLVYDYSSPIRSDEEVRQRWDERKEKSIPLLSTLTKETREKTPRNRRELENELRQIQDLKKDRSWPRYSSSEGSSVSNEDWHQEFSQISETPNTPLLPFFIGDFGHSIAKKVDVVQTVKKLTEQIGQQLLTPSEIPKENTLERFVILTDIIRTMDVKQLEQATLLMYSQEYRKEVTSQQASTWMVWRDAVAQAGTGPALLTISSWIEQGKVQGEEAAQIVAGLPYSARQPNTVYMQEFFKLVKSPKVIQDSRLNVTAVFAFTNLLRMSQVDEKTAHNRFPVHTFGRMKQRNNREVEDVFIPYLEKELQHAVELQDSQKIQVYTRALGNVAHPNIVRVFEPFLESTTKMTRFQRSLVVVCLNKLATLHPRLARSILYKIYTNKAEDYHMRVAAVYNLMKTNPPASMLQRMAQDSTAEHSPQVSSAVASALQSAATLKGHENAQLRAHAEAAVGLLPTQEYPVQYSKQNFTDYMVSGIDLGYTQTQKYFGSRDNLIPHAVFYHLRQNLNGLTQGMGVGAMVSSISDLFLQDIYQPAAEVHQNTPTESEWSYEKIMNTLNLQPQLRKQVEGNILLNWDWAKRFYTFDNTTLQILSREIAGLLSPALAQGTSINYQKMFYEDEIVLAFPTATGLPFVYTLSHPTIVSVRGEVKAAVENSRTPTRSLKSDVSLQVTFSSRAQARLSIVVPFRQRQYTAGHDRNTHISIPIRAQVELLPGEAKLVIQWQSVSQPSQQKQRILHFSTIPFTSQQDILSFKPLAEEPTTKLIQVRQPQGLDRVYSDKITGLAFRVQGLTEQTHMDFKTIYDHILRYDIISALIYPWSKTTIERNSFDILFDPELSSMKSIVMVARYDKLQEPLSQENLSDEEINRAIPDSLTLDSKERRQQLLRNAQSGIQGAISHVVDLGLKIESKNPAQLLATVAFASSPVDEKSRLLVFAFKNQEELPFQVALDVNSVMPFVSTSNLQEALQDQQKGQLRAKLNYGENAKTGAKISISTTLDKSEERRQYLQLIHQQFEKKQGKQRAHAVYVAGSWDKYDIQVRYENIGDRMRNFTYQTYSVLRHLGYPYMRENLISPRQQVGQIQAKVQISPSIDTANVDLFTPIGDARFTNVRLSRYWADMLTIHPQMSFAKKAVTELFGHYQSTCIFEKNQISTFNSQEYPALLGETWHVLMISRPQTREDQQRVVVLGRQTPEQTQEVKMILTDNTVVMVTPKRNTDPKEPQVIVTINNEVIPLAKGIIVERRYNKERSYIWIKARPNGEVQLSASEVELIHDGERVQVKSRMGYMNQLRGLCGPHNGERKDFIAPKEFMLENPEEFVATWALSHEGRIGEMQKRAEERSNIRWRIMPGNYVSEQDAGRADKMGHLSKKVDGESVLDYSSSSSSESHELSKTSSRGCAIQRIQVLERDGQHCFSLLPQPTCAHKCEAKETKIRTTKFYCVPKSTTSEHWAERVLRGSVPDFSTKGNAQEMQFEAPVKCRR